MFKQTRFYMNAKSTLSCLLCPPIQSKDPRLVFPRGRGLLLQDLRDSDSGTYSGFDERTKNEDNIMALRVLGENVTLISIFNKSFM